MDVLRPGWAVKAIVVIIITSLLFRCVSATNYSVGGSTGWDLASDLRTWSAAATFHVGDSLVFTYSPLHDVLEVNESDFESCRISQPIDSHRDGNTVIQLRQTGSRYFICGRLGHCNMGLKLRVQVLPQLVTNATNAGSDGSGNDDGDNHGSAEAAGRRSRRRPPKRPPPRHPPPSVRHPPPPPPGISPPLPPGPPLTPLEPVPPPAPPAASPCTCSEAPHLEAAGSLNWWFLSLNTLLLMISFWPRETLRFLFTFYVL